MSQTLQTLDILDRLIAHDTVSHRPNIALMEEVRGWLEAAGARVFLLPDDTGGKANLFASIGPEGDGGVMLSGHTDVVPVEGQEWTRPPFELTEEGGKFYGRGTADMKGFCASAIATMLKAAERPLQAPLHLALSHDEEIGCIGVRSLIDVLEAAPFRPRFCIVGEPTGMQVATGHKGKVALRTTCVGREGHSALAPMALNALHLAADFIGVLRRVQRQVAENGAKDGDYDVAYTTLHAGKMSGGVQVNIVPNRAVIDWEIRSLAEEDVGALIARVEAGTEAVVAPLRAEFPEAEIRTERLWDYPGLSTPSDGEVVNFVKGLTGGNATIKVAFGTEGGLFDARLGVPTVICGPGSMAQGHRPDEFVSRDQLNRCDTMLEALVAWLEAGL